MKTKQYKQEWRLPDGTYTTNAKKMCKVWENLYKPFCEAFDCRVIGFDPDILFGYGNKSFDMPISVVQKIVAILPKK